jgi:hypothetical protein
MLLTKEIPEANTLRINSRISQEEKLAIYLKKLKAMAPTELVRSSNNGDTSWLIPVPFELYDLFTKEVVLFQIGEIFLPFGYRVKEQPEECPYIAISW